MTYTSNALSSAPDNQARESRQTELLAAKKLPVSGYGATNWRGLFTLTVKETHRFLKISAQTLVAPVVTILLFYAVFKLTFGTISIDGAVEKRIGMVPFMAYMIPGLVMMGLTQNAFFNTSSSLVLSKIQGNIVDLLLAPISPFETVLAYVLSGIFRGLLVGALSIAAIALFEPITFFDIGYVIYHGTMGALFLSLLGLLTGLWADKFEQLMAVQNILILPATFLSGTFFSIASLPEPYRIASQFNPFYYMIDGFRYGLTGAAETSLPIGLLVILALNALLFAAAQIMIAKGKTIRN